jgi:hypothetical protein
MSDPLKEAQIKTGDSKIVLRSGNELRRSDQDYIDILQEKEKMIEGLENKLFINERVIDRQYQAIEDLMRKLNPKKSIVADWLEPQPVVKSPSNKPESVDGYITINV